MSSPNPFSSRWWLLVPLCAALAILGIDYGRVRDVQRVSAVGSESADGETGHQRGHWLVVPEHNSHSYQWLAETEQMVTQGEPRVRFVRYENAPVGREVNSASPYRWWLGSIRWIAVHWAKQSNGTERQN